MVVSVMQSRTSHPLALPDEYCADEAVVDRLFPTGGECGRMHLSPSGRPSSLAQRGPGTGSEFIQWHAQTLYACDFFTKKVWTCQGLVEIYVLVFLHVGSRRIPITGMTRNPDAAWMAQQARSMALFFAQQPDKPEFLIRDLDTKFTAEFDAILQGDGVEIVPVGPRART